MMFVVQAACIALAALAVPFIGTPLVERTYRTDPALASMPAPATSPSACSIAAFLTVTIISLAPLAGWPVATAIFVGPLLGLAFLTDTTGRVLPDLLTGTIAATGLVLATAGMGLDLDTALIAGGLIGCAVLVFRFITVRLCGPEAFCLGDVKLLMACAVTLPAAHLGMAIIMTAPIALLSLCFTPKANRGDAAASLPFGSLFVAGLVVTVTALAGTTIFAPNISNDFLWSLGL